MMAPSSSKFQRIFSLSGTRLLLLPRSARLLSMTGGSELGPMGKPKYASGAYRSPLQNGCLRFFTATKSHNVIVILRFFTATKSHNVIAIGMNCCYCSGSNDIVCVKACSMQIILCLQVLCVQFGLAWFGGWRGSRICGLFWGCKCYVVE